MKIKSLVIDVVLFLKILILRKDWFLINFGSIGDNIMAMGVLKAYQEEKGKCPIVIIKKNVFNSEIELGLNYNRLKNTYLIIRKLRPLCPKPVVIKYVLDKVDKKTHLSLEMAKNLNFQNHRKFYNPWMPEPLKPELFDADKFEYVAIQSSSKTSFTPNKNWIRGRMAKLSSQLKKDFKIVQIGLDEDEEIHADVDLRGKLSILETAWVIKNALLFIGLEGALMHISAFTKTPSVILFGGYISPEMTTYPGVEAIFTELHCSPCLLKEECPYNMECMDQISVEMVFEKAFKTIEKRKKIFSS